MMNFITSIIAMMDVVIGIRLISKKTTTEGLEKASLRFVGCMILLLALIAFFGLLLCKFTGGSYNKWQVMLYVGCGVYGILVGYWMR
ncbi:hypothetical protein KKC44_01295 [Patescibacteria group bacterium]|nr:hypothetical protein [Patescibacteria group bacterium]MBU2259217.1 hypothetical protein [Patescibacteria group bacterium]